MKLLSFVFLFFIATHSLAEDYKPQFFKSLKLVSATFGPWSSITSSAIASWWGRRSIPQDT